MKYYTKDIYACNNARVFFRIMRVSGRGIMIDVLGKTYTFGKPFHFKKR